MSSGMMFGAVPPSMMNPCTRASSRSCWRQSETPLYAWTNASSALMPWSGLPAACAALPRNVHSQCVHASAYWTDAVRSEGWKMSTASQSSNSPSRQSGILPPPPSSAGAPDDGHARVDPAVGERARQRDAGAGRRRRDQIVPACVSEAAECVVLADKCDVGAGVAVPRNESGRHPRHPALDLEIRAAR